MPLVPFINGKRTRLVFGNLSLYQLTTAGRGQAEKTHSSSFFLSFDIIFGELLPQRRLTAPGYNKDITSPEVSTLA